MINRKTWDNFIDQVRSINIKGQRYIDIDEVISYKETQRVLLEKGESGITEIINDTNINTKRKESTNRDNRIVEQDIQIKKAHDKIKQIKSNIETKCLSFWKKLMNIFIIVIAFMLIFLFCKIINLYGLNLILKYLSYAGLFIPIILITISLVSEKSFRFLTFILTFFLNMKRKLMNYFVSKCLKRKNKMYID
jgi:hypothetical protein